MNPRPRVTARPLIKWVAIAAVVLALVRHPYRLIREQQHFFARAREGQALLQAYRAQCPPGVSPASWSRAVDVVQTAWANVVFSPHHIDDADLDAILAELRIRAPLATPADSEGDLYHILDLLSHARTRIGVDYLSNMRIWVKLALSGPRKPSPGLVAYALSRLGPTNGDPPLDRLIRGMTSADWATRVACCRSLGQYAPGLETPAELQAALVSLLAAIEDDDRYVREFAIECVLDILKSDPCWDVRGKACQALAGLGPVASPALPALIDRLNRDDTPATRSGAIYALSQVAPDDPRTVTALARALETDSDSDQVRLAAAFALGELGPPASPAIPRLTDALKDPHPSIRGAAETALAKIRGRP